MYQDFFGLKELPFSIAPDPRYLYMSERHREALAHLLYGVSGQGGFVVLTGEVGTGKTTICRCFLGQVPSSTDVAFIVNPKVSARELLASICDELSIDYAPSSSIKVLNDLINNYLLQSHSESRHTVLIIDEAQNLRVDVLEQLRLLTNLETSEKKLLQIVLLGQPELRDMLARSELRQLSQRVTARYHLRELNLVEVGAYIQCRLSVAGRKNKLFDQSAIKQLHKESGGVPRLINLFADRALLGAYANQHDLVNKSHVKQAVGEIIDKEYAAGERQINFFALTFTFILISLMSLGAWWYQNTFDQPVASDRTLEEPYTSQAEVATPSIEQVIADEQSPPNTAEIDQIERAPAMLDQDTLIVDSKAEQTLSDELNPFVNSFQALVPAEQDIRLAYEAVFKEWGFAFGLSEEQSACRFADLQGLGCMHRKGSWRSLIQIDRPAVLSLQADDGSVIHVALLQVRDQYVQFAYGNDVYWTHLDVLQSAWFGKFSVIWRKPPFMNGLIRPNESSDKNIWLSQKLSSLFQSGGSSSQQVSLEQMILKFQREQGLIADGVVGELTLIKLNDVLESNLPSLSITEGAS